VCILYMQWALRRFTLVYGHLPPLGPFQGGVGITAATASALSTPPPPAHAKARAMHEMPGMPPGAWEGSLPLPQTLFERVWKHIPVHLSFLRYVNDYDNDNDLGSTVALR
jgi:hypothetical protein